MGYRFSGFFVDLPPWNQSLMNTVLKRWPECRVKGIYSPFASIGVSFPDHQKCRSDEDAEHLLQVIDRAKSDLTQLSHEHPQATFVWIDADCFGGNCCYEGFACRDGEILLQEEGEGALRRLMATLGLKLGPNEYFEPFRRGFFQ